MRYSNTITMQSAWVLCILHNTFEYVKWKLWQMLNETGFFSPVFSVSIETVHCVPLHFFRTFYGSFNVYSPIIACNATTIIRVCLRPYSSDNVPLERLPMAAPAKKHISMKCNIVESSQTTFHSDWIVRSLISESKANRVHFSNSFAPLWLDDNPFWSRAVRFLAMVQAPSGWETFRQSDNDKFIVDSNSAGTAHQKSRSTAYS